MTRRKNPTDDATARDLESLMQTAAEGLRFSLRAVAAGVISAAASAAVHPNLKHPFGLSSPAGPPPAPREPPSTPDKVALARWVAALDGALRAGPPGRADAELSRFPVLVDEAPTLGRVADEDPLAVLTGAIVRETLSLTRAHAEALRSVNELLAALAGDPEVVALYSEQAAPMIDEAEGPVM